MSITFRGVSNAAGEGGGPTTDITLTKPSGTVSGDLMIAVFCNEYNGDAVTTTPTGWQVISGASGGLAGRAHHLYVYYLVAGGSEPANYTWQLSSNTEIWGGIIALYDDSGGSCDIGNADTADFDDKNDGNATAPSITIQTANNWALHIASTMTGATCTPPSGTPTYDERIDGQSGGGGNNIAIAMSSALYGSSGASGTQTAVFSVADYRKASHVEIIVTSGSTPITKTFTDDAANWSDALSPTEAQLARLTDDLNA